MLDEEVLEYAIRLYRNSDFKSSVEVLKDLVASTPDYWEARLYLAMAYFNSGNPLQAREQMAHIKDHCPDQEMRRRAEGSFVLLSVTRPDKNAAKGKDEPLSMDELLEDQETEEIEVIWTEKKGRKQPNS